MNTPTLQNDDYAQLELQIAIQCHQQAMVVSAQLHVKDAGSGWYRHPGYLFNLCKVAQVIRANRISTVDNGTTWTALKGDVAATSIHLEVAVWTLFLGLPTKGVFK